MAGKSLKGTQEPREPQGGVRGRVAGEPPLPLLRARRGHRGLPGHRGPVQGHRRRRDRPRVRAPRLPEGGRRPRHRRAHRQDGEEPEGGGRGRDLRVHADVPRHGQDRARRGLRRAGGVVRDAGQGGEVPRRPLRQGSHAGRRAKIRPTRSRAACRGRAPLIGPPAGPAAPPPARRPRRADNGMTLDIRQPEFWKLDAVDHELRRVYDICAGCRRCLPLCPSFKVMFDRLDVDAVDGDVEKLPAARREGSRRSLLPVQALLQPLPVHAAAPLAGRFPPADAARALGGGAGAGRHPAGPVARQHRAGRAARQPDRAALELDERAPAQPGRDAGGGRHPQGPPAAAFHRETFSRWFDQRRRPTVPAPLAAPAKSKVALFATCSVEYNEPGTGKAAVAVLEKNGVDVSPARAAVLRHAVPRRRARSRRPRRSSRDNVQSLAAAVREGREIVVPGPTCSLHAQAGVSVARRLGGRQPRRRPHARPVRVPGRPSRRRGASTRASRSRRARSRTSCPAI